MCLLLKEKKFVLKDILPRSGAVVGGYELWIEAKFEGSIINLVDFPARNKFLSKKTKFSRTFIRSVMFSFIFYSIFYLF